ncbi:4-hydroxy-3-methylbut-2-en-1-yl diphosphate synthase (ferredoxin) [Streptomyces cyaneofuscatus]
MTAISLGMPAVPTKLADRRVSRQIQVGSVAVGGDAPVSVQSMTTTRTSDIGATLQQIAELDGLRLPDRPGGLPDPRSPLAGDGGLLYQARVAELIGAGRSFARIDDGKVVFKAEIGAATTQACQIQGVWVAPEHRGKGLSETGMAAVLRYALADVAPIVSLYVNDYNAPARKAYRRVGFRETGTFMSVLF